MVETANFMMKAQHITANHIASQENARQRAGSLILKLISLWLLVQLFSNDITNDYTINMGINMRLDRIILIIIVIIFISFCFKNNVRPKATVIEALIFLFCCILIISCLISNSLYEGYRLDRNLSTICNFALIPGLIFIIVRNISITPESVRYFLNYMLLVGIYLIITTCGEHYNVSWLVYPSYIMDPTIGICFGRARGSFVNPPVLGAMLVMVFGSAIILYRNSLKWYYVFSLPFIITANYFTYTRSCWIMFGSYIGVLALVSREYRKWVLVLALGIVVIFVSGVFSKFSMDRTLFSERTQTIDDRYNVMHATWTMFLEKPLFGFGYGAFEKVGDDYFVALKGIELRGMGEGNHNVLLGLMAEVGIGATILFLLLYIHFILIGIKLASVYKNGKNPFISDIAKNNIALVASFFIGAQFYDPRFFCFLNSFIYIMSAIVYNRYDLIHNMKKPGK
jgi:hypothetical protein